MMNNKFYDILGVDKNATQDEIKKAYKKLALELHPDKHSDKTEEEKTNLENKFKEVAEAYTTLSDPEKRKQYDLTGSNSNFNYNNFHDPDLEEFLSRFAKNTHFGFGGYHNMDMGFSTQDVEYKGQDVNLKISVTLDELYNGCTKKFKYKVNRPCTNCEGGKKEKCPICNGLGMVTRQVSGWSTIRSTCSACGGTGDILTKTSCRTCGGTGLTNIEETVEVVIEPGLTIGNGVVMKEKGHSLPKGVKGKAGDLNIIIANVTNSIFNIRGNDLYIEKEIPIVDVLLGSEIEIPSLSKEKLKVKIPANTLNGSSFRLLNKGLPLYGGTGYGNLYVTVKHKFPTKEIDNTDRKLLEKLKKSNNFK